MLLRILMFLLIPIAVQLFFSLTLCLKKREEKRINTENEIRTKPPKVVSIFFLGFAIISSVGLILACIFSEGLEEIELVCIILICSLFLLLGGFGYLWVAFNYVIAKEDEIVVFKLFGKTKTYKYSEIGYFIDQTDLGMAGALICYDKNLKKIFMVEAISLGVGLVVQKLKDKNVIENMNKKVL